MGRTTEQLTSTVEQAAHVRRCSRDGLATLERAVDAPRRCLRLEEALRAALGKVDQPGAPQDGIREAMVVAPPPGLELVAPLPGLEPVALPPGLGPIAPPPGLEPIAPCRFSRQSTESTAAPSDREEPSSPEPASARGSSADGGVLRGLTTAMIRQVPLELSQDRLAKLLGNRGFAGEFDFLYVPMDARRKTNRGVAFVNFTSPEVAERFFHAFDGLELPIASGSGRPLVIAAADVQGFEENVAKHAACQAPRKFGSPMILRPCPRLVARASLAPVATAAASTKAAVVAAVAPQPERRAAAHGAAPTPKVQPRFCHSCGQARMTSTHAFCPFCGEKFL